MENIVQEAISAPVSPAGQFLSNSVLSLSVIAVLETEVPFDDSQTVSLLNNVFLPINPRFSSIMVLFLSFFLSFFFSSLVPFILMHKRENLGCFFSLNISYCYKFACKFKENFQFHINWSNINLERWPTKKIRGGDNNRRP